LWKIRGKQKHENIPELRIDFGRSVLTSIIRRLFPDKTDEEIKKLFPAGKICINDKQINDPEQEVDLSKGDILRIGERNFFEIAEP
jgi:hypothetical protein